MNHQKTDEAFAALLANRSVRSKIGQLREVFDRVEEALRLGVSRSAILATLRSLGLDLKPSSFNEFVVRLRRERTAAQSADRPSARADTSALPGPILAAGAVETVGVAVPDRSPSAPPSAPGAPAPANQSPLARPQRTLEEVLKAGPPDMFALEQAAARRRRERKLAEAKVAKPV